jgi:two-component sensor histidine kinase/putative methionine-R-sulfoxide reductase with GAF domain
MSVDRDEEPAVPPEMGGDPAEELAYRLRQQELVAQFGAFALNTHDVAELLQEATRVCAEGLQSEFAKAMEYLPSENQLIVRAGVGWRRPVVGIERVGADDESPCGYAFRTGIPVISNHLHKEQRFRTPKLLAEHGIERAINVRIQVDDRPFGVLEVDSPKSARFTEADLAFMRAFANLLSLAIKRHRSETRLETALSNQEMLNREISHRVKNSLMIVGSLLSMQRRNAADQELRNALADAQSRVETIASVHDRLSRTNDVQTVNLAGFFRDLSDQFRASAENVTLHCAVANVSVPTNEAVSLGLLVNELLTNILKYAYPAKSGDAWLSLESSDLGKLRLEVVDRGVGLPAGFDVAQTNSLGTKLISRLGRQLGGEPEWHDAQPGTRFVLDFPVPNDPS